MIIAVLLKSVPDTAAVPQVTENGRAIETGHLEFVMNPYDEHALEEAIRLKEATGGRLTAISVGNTGARKILRAALAVGADEAVLICDPRAAGLTGRGIAKVLAKVLERLTPDVVFAGKQAMDEDGAQVPERVAEILGLAHASAVTTFAAREGGVTVHREVEEGHLVLDLPLPVLLTVQKGINAPRYPTLPDTIKAGRKPIMERTLSDLDLDPAALRPGLKVEGLELARQTRLQKIIQGDLGAQTRELATMVTSHNAV